MVKPKSTPRISIQVITYNQERLIRRALDSIISQKNYVYEICICDDHSTDRTWEIILDYKKKFPNLIKAIRNEQNIGIFENIEKCWTLPTGDVVCSLAGDDEVGNGWFKKVVEFIQQNNIDYKNELFCIYGDHKCIYPNGDSFIFHNKMIKKKISPLKLYERGMISNRSTCYSVKILKKFKKVSQGKSYIAENAQSAQLHLFVEKTYYLPFIGNVYYANIGVSSTMNKNRLKEHEQTMLYAFKFFGTLGVDIDKYDLLLPNFNIAVKKMRQNVTLMTFFNVVKYYIKSFDPKIGIQDIQFKKYLFALLRRIPHKNPIHW